jgi:hypothetical protein
MISLLQLESEKGTFVLCVASTSSDPFQKKLWCIIELPISHTIFDFKMKQNLLRHYSREEEQNYLRLIVAYLFEKVTQD